MNSLKILLSKPIVATGTSGVLHIMISESRKDSQRCDTRAMGFPSAPSVSTPEISSQNTRLAVRPRKVLGLDRLTK